MSPENSKTEEGVWEEEKKHPWKRIRREFREYFNCEHYRAQRLPACTPVITFGSVIPTFLFASLISCTIGALFLYVSFNDQSFRIDYTDCLPLSDSRSCAQRLSDWNDHQNGGGRWPPPTCTCWYKFHFDKPLQANAFVYYGLSNYYQNHLHYIRSKDFAQFHGHPSLSHDCEPFRWKPVLERVLHHPNNGTSRMIFIDRGIVPCGTRANSLFNDTFTFWYKGDDDDHHGSTVVQKVPLSRINIAWPVDKYTAIHIDPDVFRNFTNPPYWGNKTVWDLDPKNPDNNGLKNEALIVWMRVAAFPVFRKLYARIVHRKTFRNSLPSGQYYLKIEYNYPVKSFGGRKFFILANTNRYLGGPYLFLAIIYLIVSLLCIVWAVVLYMVHRRFGLSLEEMIDIDETTPYIYDGNARKRKPKSKIEGGKK